MRWAAWVAIGVLVLAASAELVLQAAARFVGDRAETSSVGRVAIVCVGDSHTYGAAVAPEEAYPSRLQVELDYAAPGHYRVINLGIPGHNTSQVLNRLPRQALRHEAAMILVWVGINDLWNVSEATDAAPGWGARLDALASRSRLYRLVRVRAHDREIARAIAEAGAEERASMEGELGRPDWKVRIGGQVEEYHTESVELAVDDANMKRAGRNYRAMARWARDAGIPIAFLSYPVPVRDFASVNETIKEAASEATALTIATREAILRVPEDERELLWAAHPNGPMYREIARDVARVVIETVPPPNR
jgi:lysophospholipase L1-like esterase